MNNYERTSSFQSYRALFFRQIFYIYKITFEAILTNMSSHFEQNKSTFGLCKQYT